MAYLVLVRHGISEWNKLGKWTGLSEVDLAPEGVQDAQRMGESIRDIPIHKAHVSTLGRAQQTLDEIKKVLKRLDLEAREHAALNERDYGVHTGKNKWQVKEEVGEREFQNIRRGWDAVIVGGENLKDVHARVVPYFETHMRPELSGGHNVLVVGHGNSLRALVKHLEKINDEKIAELEIDFGDVYIYESATSSAVVSKEIRVTNPNKPKL
jgi:2,3-bisphosphoglycerate-dependent phosphoglycerate mutase